MTIFTLLFWRDALERAASSFAMQAFTLFLAAGSIASVVGLPWQAMLVSGAGAAIVSLLGTVLQYASGLQSLKFYPDLGIRVLKTFVASLLGTVAADDVVNVLTISWAHALDVAAIAAFMALAKGYLARGSADSASVSTAVRASAPPSAVAPLAVDKG